MKFAIGDRIRVVSVPGEPEGAIVGIDNYIHVLRDDGRTGSGMLIPGYGSAWVVVKLDCELIENQTAKSEEEKVMDISNNILAVWQEDAVLAGKISVRFGSQYDNSERSLLALKRNKEALVKILKDEELEAKKGGE